MVKNETENRLTLLNYREAIMKFQDDLIPWKWSQQTIENKVEVIDGLVMTLRITQDLSQHMKAMEQTPTTIQEVSTWWTARLKQYEVSELTTHRLRSVQARLRYVHLKRSQNIEDEYNETSIDTEEDPSYQYGHLRGGIGGSNANVPEEDNLPALPNPPAPSNPPAPLHPPAPPNPPQPPGPEHRRKQRPQTKPI